MEKQINRFVLVNWSYAPPPHFLFNSDIVRSFLNPSDSVTILIVQCNLLANENITIIPLVPILACVVLTNPSNASIYSLVNCVVAIDSFANCAVAIYNSQTWTLGFSIVIPFNLYYIWSLLNLKIWYKFLTIFSWKYNFDSKAVWILIHPEITVNCSPSNSGLFENFLIDSWSDW